MKYALAPAIAFALFFSLQAGAITIDTVPVDNPGNPGRIQPGGIFGSVPTSYRIATTEVTNSQYVMFLNAVAASDPFGLYHTNMSFYSRGGIVRTGASGSYSYSLKPAVPDGGPGDTNYTYGDKPVILVSWYDAARFANWVNNGATAGASTETGAYTMANGVSVTRNAGAIWFLPTENQWYKAAYYDGAASVYYDYSTGSNTAPNNSIPADDTGNSANYYAGDFTQNASYPFTSAGAYAQSYSPYGTADQGGNVWEWTETAATSATRVRRGGAFDTDATKIISSYRETMSPTFESDNMGFRLATVAVGAGVPGDYNANNVVDAGDYILWRKYSGQSITLPNDSTPGTVMPIDYDVWRSHFGQTSSGSGSGSLAQTAVPEPAAMPLLAALLVVSLPRRPLGQKIAFSRSPRLY